MEAKTEQCNLQNCENGVLYDDGNFDKVLCPNCSKEKYLLITILEYYDGICAAILEKDSKKFLAFWVGEEEHERIYFGIELSEERITQMNNSEIDARSLLKNPEKNEFYYFKQEYTDVFTGEKTELTATPEDYLPSSGLFFN